MSYPLLRISQDCEHVEVRNGKGAAGWNGMTEVFSGPANAGDEWRGSEGDKLAACYRLPLAGPAAQLDRPPESQQN